SASLPFCSVVSISAMTRAGFARSIAGGTPGGAISVAFTTCVGTGSSTSSHRCLTCAPTVPTASAETAIAALTAVGLVVIARLLSFPVCDRYRRRRYDVRQIRAGRGGARPCVHSTCLSDIATRLEVRTMLLWLIATLVLLSAAPGSAQPSVSGAELYIS